MLILEYKITVRPCQYQTIDEAIRTAQFIRNKCVRHWMDTPCVGKYDLSNLCADLAKEYAFANKLNSMARQASAERAWQGITRFYSNCKKKVSGKKGYPPNSKRMLVPLSTRHQAGNSLKIENESDSLMAVGSEVSN